MPLLESTARGLFCRAGNFHIDPWQPVERAVITHAHSDHARFGSKHYLCSAPGAEILALRVGSHASIESLPYRQPVTLGDTTVSFRPAGHLLGSAQVRVEHKGEVWCVSGDYKVEPDPTCEPFDPVTCNVFISEATFALPIYRWKPAESIFADINAWWRWAQGENRTAVIYGYALGKAQRLLAGVDASIGPILVHGAVARFDAAYRSAGVALPPTQHATIASAKATRGRALVIAPPSAAAAPWLKKFGPVSQAFASGWMMVRGNRRRRALDRGFVLSDHADWPGLLAAIAATGCQRVGVTHGYTAAMQRYLGEQGLDAFTAPTRWEGEGAEEEIAGDEATPPLPPGEDSLNRRADAIETGEGAVND